MISRALRLPVFYDHHRSCRCYAEHLRRAVLYFAYQHYNINASASSGICISRKFPIRERLKLSLLGEAFNVFNHTNVYTVNTQQYTYTGPGNGRLPGPYERIAWCRSRAS